MSLSLPLARLEHKGEHPGDRGVTLSGIVGHVADDFLTAGDALAQIQAKLMVSRVLARLLQQQRSAGGVGACPLGLSFPDLHSCSRQLDQGLDQGGRGAPSTVGVPERLPGFVSFPVVARVEKLDAAEIERRLGPAVGLDGYSRLVPSTEQMPGLRSDRVRPGTPGNVRVRR